MVAACSPPHKELTISNSLDLFRVDEPVVISRADLEAHFGLTPAGMLPVLISEAGDTIPVQHDDTSGDGFWDELFFLATLEPTSQATFRLVYIDPVNLPSFIPRSNVRFAKIEGDDYIPLVSARRLTAEEGLAGGIFQMEGPGWENDRVGFRNYFDVRNGMDIFGKTTTEMVLDRVGINEDYHVMQSWGMDILKVGASLGAGSLAIEKDGKLFRVAPDAAGSYELIVDGPLRSILRFRFDDWEVDGQTFSVVHDISIWGGAWFYQSYVYLEGNAGDATIVTGITTLDLDEKEPYIEFIENGVAVVASHGQQAFDGEYLGMAVMLAEDHFRDSEFIGDGDDIVETIIVRMPVTDQQAVIFRFYSCWEFNERQFAETAFFKSFLLEESKKMLSPININLM